MKKTGVWIDKEKAHIITLENDKENILTVFSEVENFHITSNQFLGGSQEILADKKILEREKNQLKTYFKEIASHLMDADVIVIFGPAETGVRFRKELQENYRDLSTKIKGVEKADSMTENQVKAWVREYFQSN